MRTQAFRPPPRARLRLLHLRPRPPREARCLAGERHRGRAPGAQLAASALGRALAVAKNLDPKHAIKQVDRFFSSLGVDVWQMAACWVPFVVGARPEIVAALDWTDFDADNQSTIALHLITKHGRSTPRLWKRVKKSDLEGWRNEHEDDLLERFRAVVPQDVRVTILADRGPQPAGGTASRA